MIPPVKVARPGERPPLSAATSAGSGGSDLSGAPDESDLAVPGDGRTPGSPLSVARCPQAALALGVLLATAAALVLFCFDPRQYQFYPLCIFHKTTGLLCPGCGALRATHQLLHGHLAAAFHFNPMLVASLPFASWFGARFAWQQTRPQPLSLGLRPAWLWLMLAAVLVVSVLRNVPGVPFALLRP